MSLKLSHLNVESPLIKNSQLFDQVTLRASRFETKVTLRQKSLWDKSLWDKSLRQKSLRQKSLWDQKSPKYQRSHVWTNVTLEWKWLLISKWIKSHLSIKNHSIIKKVTLGSKVTLEWKFTLRSKVT